MTAREELALRRQEYAAADRACFTSNTRASLAARIDRSPTPADITRAIAFDKFLSAVQRFYREEGR